MEAPAFALALLVAELLYKFHSFSLECLCFLATWLVFSTALSFVSSRWPRLRSAPHAEESR